jgi:HSP20 family protein
MNLTNWNKPNASSIERRFSPEISLFGNNANSLFDTFFDRSNHLMPLSENYTFYPSIDIKDLENQYLLEAEVPGMKEEEIELDIRNNTLIIKGKKTINSKDEKADYVCTERSHGEFKRSITFPEAVDAASVNAVLNNGILSVECKKRQKPNEVHKKIKIKH